jgi:AcrR family transcriptional regulator
MNYLMNITSRTKSSKQRTEVRQANLIEAALQLAAQRSPAGITTADLARAVGISQGAVFKHFASKEAIWLAVLDWTTETLMSRLHAVVLAPNAAPALVTLRAVFMAHVAFAVDYPGVPRVIFQELQSPQDTALKNRVRGLMQGYRDLLLNVLQLAQVQKALQPDLDMKAAVVLFIGSVQGLVMQAMISGDIAAMKTQAPGVFDIVQRGLQCQPNLTQGNP